MQDLRRKQGPEVQAKEKTDALLRMQALRRKQDPEVQAKDKAAGVLRKQALRREQGPEVQAKEKTDLKLRMQALRRKKGPQMQSKEKGTDDLITRIYQESGYAISSHSRLLQKYTKKPADVVPEDILSCIEDDVKEYCTIDEMDQMNLIQTYSATTSHSLKLAGCAACGTRDLANPATE